MAATKKYEKIERSKLWSLIQSGAELYVIDMKQLKVLQVDNLTVIQINYYYADAATFFVQAISTEVSNG